MSFGELVYPGAVHTRFSHSLGVMHLAARLSEYLLLEETVSRDVARALVWAGLLHDIGHFPFSHSFEPALQRFYFEAKGLAKDKHWGGAHERFGRELVLRNKGIVEAIGSKAEAGVVCDIIEGVSRTPGKHSNLMKAAMKERFCVDKLDYIQRDALFAGTPEYAAIDDNRIISSFLTQNGKVYHRIRAQYALEGMILSYFYLYKAVYFHKTIRAAYCLFQSLLWDAFESGVLRSIALDSDKFWVGFDDAHLLEILRSKGSAALRGRLDCLQNRTLPKVILDSNDFGTHGGARLEIQRLCAPNTDSFEKKCELERKMRQSLGVNQFFVDSPLLVPYPPLDESEFPLIAEDEKNPADNNCPLHEKAPHIKELLAHQPVARVYMSQKWSSVKEKKQIRESVLDRLNQHL